MRFKGFNMNCISWAQAIQSSGTSSILLKGILRKQFECKRGFAKGIQFHHVLLYLFVSDLLRSSVNQMVLQGSVYLPIITNDEDFPIIQYPDDTLLIRNNWWILKKFSLSTGLNINYEKLQMVRINVTGDLVSDWLRSVVARWVKCCSHTFVCLWGYKAYHCRTTYVCPSDGTETDYFNFSFYATLFSVFLAASYRFNKSDW
jgi:hypothetical protein